MTALRVTERHFLWSFFASYTLLVIHLYGSQTFRLSTNVVWGVYSLEVILITLAILVARARGGSLRLLLCWSTYRSWLTSVRNFANVKFLFSLVFIGLIIIWKPYTEIPADFWQHLEYIRSARNAIEMGQAVPDFNLWYVVQGWIWYLSNASVNNYIQWTWLFNALVFSIGCFVVAKSLFQSVEVDSKTLEIGSAIATVGMLLMFGVGVFSYFRYYTFAPGFFSYILYLFSLSCLYTFTQKEHSTINRVRSAVLVPVLGVVVYLIHRQEALFIFLMFSISALYVIIDYCLTKFVPTKEQRMVETPHRDKTEGGAVRRRLGIMAFVILIITVVMLMLIDYKTEPVTHRDILDLGSIAGFLGGLKIIKMPSQVSDIYGILGLIVVIATLVTYRVGGVPVVLLLSVVVVVVTLFNPVFVSIFLRLSEQEVLWRIGYMTPWPLMLGLLFFKAHKCSRLPKRLASSLVLLPIIFSIGFIVMGEKERPKWIDISFKVPTLQSTPHANSYQFINDLIVELNERAQGNRHILTDPVTGYVLAATTKHSHRRWKFHPVDYIDFNLPGYSDRSFEDYKGWLVVVNRRDGALSRTGKVSGHWPETILHISDYYSVKFLNFVDQYTEPEGNARVQKSAIRFRKLWHSDDISLYEVI